MEYIRPPRIRRSVHGFDFNDSEFTASHLSHNSYSPHGGHSPPSIYLLQPIQLHNIGDDLSTVDVLMDLNSPMEYHPDNLTAAETRSYEDQNRPVLSPPQVDAHPTSTIRPVQGQETWNEPRQALAHELLPQPVTRSSNSNHHSLHASFPSLVQHRHKDRRVWFLVKLVSLFLLGFAVLLVYAIRKHDLGTGTGLCALVWTAGGALCSVLENRWKRVKMEEIRERSLDLESAPRAN